METSLEEIRKTFYRLDPDVPLTGGETIETAIGDLQVIWTPGHSPGHICLYQPERRVLFSGDHILEHISPNIGWQPDHDALGEFLSSLDRIAALQVDLVLPSHGAPFRGHREWVAKTRAHHAERCDLLLGALDGQSQDRGRVDPQPLESPAVAVSLPLCRIRIAGAPGSHGAHGPRAELDENRDRKVEQALAGSPRGLGSAAGILLPHRRVRKHFHEQPAHHRARLKALLLAGHRVVPVA